MNINSVIIQLIPAIIIVIYIVIFKKKERKTRFDCIYLGLHALFTISLYGFIMPFFLFWGSNSLRLSGEVQLLGRSSWSIWESFWSYYIFGLWIASLSILFGLAQSLKTKWTLKQNYNIKMDLILIGLTIIQLGIGILLAIVTVPID